MSRRDRIREMVAARSHDEDRGYETPCRIWDGPTSGEHNPEDRKTRGHSYPRMNLDGATVAVHKTVWVNENGIVPPKKQIEHKCAQRDCVREDHLEMLTHKANQKRKQPKPAPPPEPMTVRVIRLHKGVGKLRFKLIFAEMSLEEIEEAARENRLAFRLRDLGVPLPEQLEHEIKWRLPSIYNAVAVEPICKGEIVCRVPDDFGMPDVVIPRDGQMMIVDFKTREDPPWGSYNENVPAPDGFDPTNPSDRTYRPPVLRPGTERTYIPGHGLIDAHIAKAPEEPADG